MAAIGPPSVESKILGLSESEARRLLETEGFNELPTVKRRRLWILVSEILREPMVAILVICSGLYSFLGDTQEAGVMVGFLGLLFVITVYQENKAEHALQALADLASPRALVLRDGKRRRIPGREVVSGDILFLSEGDRVPADGVIRSSTSLSVDESLLTGESISVEKKPCDHAAPSLPSECRVFAATTAVRGQAVIEVSATGSRTEVGKIGKAIERTKTERTPLQTETQRIVAKVAWVSASLCVLTFVVYGLTRGQWLNGLLAGLTLAMAILPNELPAVLTIFLALGAWRISKHRVLARRMPAVEMLGATTVLCVDKTGTLTLNRMSVRKIYSVGQYFDFLTQDSKELPEIFHETVEYGILASPREPVDPMERAVIRIGDEYLLNTEHLHRDWNLLREYPISPELLAVSYVWRPREGGTTIVGAKGAPEAIMDLCHMSDDVAREMRSAVQQMAGEGLRVLGVAKAKVKQDALPPKAHDFEFEFVGLVGLEDPVRPGVPKALQECRNAGVRVVMITGDHPDTARSIARQIGLQDPDQVITGHELQEMSQDELERRLPGTHCFARMVPEQKLKLVTALKKSGEIVAMTGDGVNDAPALKAAHIGIAMGGRGTDVARESASLVLLDDDFSSIVDAIRMGRRIFDNLRSALAYLLAAHVPIAGITIVPVFMNLPLVLLPAHVALLHLIIEPACSIGFEVEPAHQDIMRRPPRNPKEPLFSKSFLWPSFFQGLSVFSVILAVYLIALYRQQGESDARALTFTTLIIANLGLIFANRSWTKSIWASFEVKNKALMAMLFGTLAVMGLVLYVPSFQRLFRFSHLHRIDLVICLGAGLLSILWFDWWKAHRKRNPS